LPRKPSLSRHLRDARIKRRLSVAEVAEQVGVRQSSIYFWETDHCRPRTANPERIVQGPEIAGQGDAGDSCDVGGSEAIVNLWAAEAALRHGGTQKQTDREAHPMTRQSPMRKHNQWRHGKQHLVVPPLSDAQLGAHGCSLQSATFDPDIGEEVYALYLEEPKFAKQYDGVNPFNMFAHTGATRTPHGIVGFIIWVIAAGSQAEITVEDFLNPQNIEELRLVSSAGSQTHFKLVIVNNMTSEVAAFVDFENVFGFDELAGGLAKLIGHEAVGDFATAMRYVMDNFSTEQLIRGAD
jgi:Helix-turn-helix domain